MPPPYSTLHVPDERMLCGYCDEYVEVFGERRLNADGKPHKCPGYLASKKRGKL